MSETEWPLQTCSCRYGGFRGLFDLGECKLGDFVWVCGQCLWPSIMYWEQFIDSCPECGEDYCAPWEDKCDSCIRRFPEERPDDQPYLDWSWARQRYLDEYGAENHPSNGQILSVSS